MKNVNSKEVSVLVAGPFNEPFDYVLEDKNINLSIGQIVLVPFGKRKTVGIIIGNGTKTISEKKLKTVFQDNGTVTPGNSSGINDGAAALLLTSLEQAEKKTINPLVKKSIYELNSSNIIKDKFTILIVGGSQGANIFNKKLKEFIINITKKK